MKTSAGHSCKYHPNNGKSVTDQQVLRLDSWMVCDGDIKSPFVGAFLLSVFLFFSIWYASSACMSSFPPRPLIPSSTATKRLKRDYFWHVNVMRPVGILLFYFSCWPKSIRYTHKHTHVDSHKQSDRERKYLHYWPLLKIVPPFVSYRSNHNAPLLVSSNSIPLLRFAVKVRIRMDILETRRLWVREKEYHFVFLTFSCDSKH